MSGIDDCLVQAMAIPGAIGTGLVDYSSGFALGTAGRAPADDPDGAWAGASEVVNTAVNRAPFASTRPGDRVEDIIVTTLGGYHIFRQVHTQFDSRLVLYLWLDRSVANLAIARRKLQLLADNLVAASAAVPAPASGAGR